MITPRSDQMGRIVRVLTYGKDFEAIDQAILEAVEDGQRVLVKVASASDTSVHDAASASVIADWAEALSQKHGLGWERVGGDVLFHRASPRAVPETS